MDQNTSIELIRYRYRVVWMENSYIMPISWSQSDFVAFEFQQTQNALCHFSRSECSGVGRNEESPWHFMRRIRTITFTKIDNWHRSWMCYGTQVDFDSTYHSLVFQQKSHRVCRPVKTSATESKDVKETSEWSWR